MFQQFISRVQASIRQIIAKRHAALTCGFTNVLGLYDKLKGIISVRAALIGRAPKGQREPLKRLARVVALISFTLMGIALSETADGGSINDIPPKRYIALHYSKTQALCLIKLYGKESAFNSKAIGNDSGKSKAYGIPQLKSEFIKDLSPNKQIDYGMKYITHRYKGKPCLALSHSNRLGWY